MEEQLYRKFYEVETTHWWFTARQRIVTDVIRRRLRLTKSATVLDVGCGTGAILKIFSGQFEAYGTDTSALAIEFCHKRGVDRAFQCTLDTFPYQNLKFDLVTSFDVIEHIEDDLGALRRIYDFLKPGGFVFVTVPAYKFLWSRHDDLNHHKRRYTRAMLEDVLRKSGFEIEFCSYYDMFLFPTAFVGRMAERLLQSTEDSTLNVPPAFVNITLRAIFSFERFLLRSFSLPFGLSIIALARKSAQHD